MACMYSVKETTNFILTLFLKRYFCYFQILQKSN